MTDEQILEELLLRFEATQDMGLQITLAEICKDYPHLEPKLRRELELLDMLSAEVSRHDKLPARPALAARGRPAQVGRYRPERTIGQGALGEVLLATDTELHRQVALKRLLSTADLGPESRMRFLVEAQITGRLDHPGVVPVHGLVYDGEKNPYYAMRLIRGDSLDAAIARFHRDHPLGKSGPHYSTDLQSLLRSFLAVCQTLAYAHSQGFVHRDLKPENVMVGRFGETIVVDWGLANRFAGGTDGVKLDATAAALPEQESALDRQIAALDVSVVGKRKGSLAYSSPEQAAGKWSEVGPRSDIYSLGATLYKLLTSQLPFTDPKRALEQIAAGEFLRPREVRSDIPFGLEAICLKAMALRPEDRYETALELAAEIERWLADEPVLAAPEPWSMQTQRWIKRNQSWILTGTVGSLVAIVALVGLAVQQNSANAQIAGGKKEADDNLVKANKNLTQANQNLRLAQKNLYLARMNLASRAVADDWTARAEEMLAVERPQPGDEVDRRQAEWFHLWHHLRRGPDPISISELVGLSADGRRYATVEQEKLLVREIGRTEPLFISKAKFAESAKFIVAPNFRSVVIDENGKVNVWPLEKSDVQEFELPFVAPEEDYLATLQFSDDSSRLATMTREGIVEVWNLATKKREHIFEDVKGNDAPPAGPPLAYSSYFRLAFSSDGLRLSAVRTNNASLSLAAGWTLADGKREFLEKSTMPVVLSLWVGHVPLLAREEEGQLDFVSPTEGNKSWFRCPDPESVAEISFENVSDLKTLVLLPWIGLRLVEFRVDGHVRTQVHPASEITLGMVAPKGEYLLVTNTKGKARIWKTDDIWEPSVLDGNLSSIQSLVYSSTGDQFFAWGAERQQPAALAVEAPLCEVDDFNDIPPPELREFDPFRVLAYDRKGRVVNDFNCDSIDTSMSSSRAQSLMIHGKRAAVLSGFSFEAFDLETQMPLPAPVYGKEPEPGVRPLALTKGSNAAEILVVESMNKQDGIRLRRWDTGSGSWKEFVYEIPLQGFIETLLVSPDGKWLIVGLNSQENPKLYVWSLAGGAKPTVELPMDDLVSTAAFSPSGAEFAAGSQSGHLVVWNTKTWKVERRINAGLNVQSIAFWPDSRWILTGDYAGHIMLWDLSEQIERFSWHPGFPVTALAVAPDGLEFVAGGSNGELRVFHLPKASDVLPVSIRQAASQPANVEAQRELGQDAWGAYLQAKARKDLPSMKESLAICRGALATLSRIRKLTAEEEAWEKAIAAAYDVKSE